MEIFFVNFTNYQVRGFFFEKTLKVIKKTEKIKKEFSLEIVLLGDKGMRNINKRYAGKNKVTDVLSFSFAEMKKPSKKELQFVEPQKTDNLVGEILLCPSRIKKEAKKKKKDFKEELTFVFIHGFLHLLGYNHKNTKDTQEMRKKEKEIARQIA